MPELYYNIYGFIPRESVARASARLCGAARLCRAAENRECPGGLPPGRIKGHALMSFRRRESGIESSIINAVWYNERVRKRCPKMPKGERKSYSKKFKPSAVYLLRRKASPPPEKPLVFSSAGNLSISSVAGKSFILSVAGPPLAFSPRRKPFDFLPRRGIMAEIEYPGVAQLVGRNIWENTTSRINKLNNRV